MDFFIIYKEYEGILHTETRHLFWYRRSACRRAASSLPSMSPTSLGVPNSVDDTSAWTVHPCHNRGLWPLFR